MAIEQSVSKWAGRGARGERARGDSEVGGNRAGLVAIGSVHLMVIGVPRLVAVKLDVRERALIDSL